MTVYVDPIFDAVPRTAQARKHGNKWSHLITDGDLEELHQFAKQIGLSREWFQRSIIPHYDLTPRKRVIAIRNGAIEKNTEELSPLKKQWMKRWNGGNPDWEKQP